MREKSVNNRMFTRFFDIEFTMVTISFDYSDKKKPRIIAASIKI
ncbi:hypothetical protein JCM19239_4473 [Vibrio variabilis]|uniref:Uncharacterized protein n=1 Tax=Vibrio variabilis TaxID=990271 RepID=A0ABQ0JPQ6_9VIBR|nr:hypothetical protein JCM19239_4473 [Vibrio variabilis]